MPVFEILITTKLTQDEREHGALESIVAGPKLLVALNEQSASLNAIMQAKEKGELEGKDIGRLDILVRPF